MSCAMWSVGHRTYGVDTFVASSSEANVAKRFSRATHPPLSDARCVRGRAMRARIGGGGDDGGFGVYLSSSSPSPSSSHARVCVCVCVFECARGSISTLRIADDGATTDDVCVRACVSLAQARTVSLVTVDMAKRTKKVGT
jgi:hypothetical protein